MFNRLLILGSVLLALIPVMTQAASLSPAVLELRAQRGEVLEETITVINTRATEQTYFLGIMQFEAQEDGESPLFIPYSGDLKGLPAEDLVDWIVLPFSEFRIPANSKGDVPLKITIPADVLSGGYYAAITVSQSPSELVADNGAVVEAKTAALVLLTVEGETKEHLELLDFSSPTSVKSTLSGTYSFRLQNQGNVHVSPKGDLILRDVFGRELIRKPANELNGRILPSSTRTYEIVLENSNGLMDMLKSQMLLFAIGPISAELNLTYGSTDQAITAATPFWYFPWQLLICVVILLGLFSLLLKKRK